MGSLCILIPVLIVVLIVWLTGNLPGTTGKQIYNECGIFRFESLSGVGPTHRKNKSIECYKKTLFLKHVTFKATINCN